MHLPTCRCGSVQEEYPSDDPPTGRPSQVKAKKPLKGPSVSCRMLRGAVLRDLNDRMASGLVGPSRRPSRLRYRFPIGRDGRDPPNDPAHSHHHSSTENHNDMCMKSGSLRSEGSDTTDLFRLRKAELFATWKSNGQHSHTKKELLWPKWLRIRDAKLLISGRTRSIPWANWCKLPGKSWVKKRARYLQP